MPAGSQVINPFSRIRDSTILVLMAIAGAIALKEMREARFELPIWVAYKFFEIMRQRKNCSITFHCLAGLPTQCEAKHSQKREDIVYD